MKSSAEDVTRLRDSLTRLTAELATVSERLKREVEERQRAEAALGEAKREFRSVEEALHANEVNFQLTVDTIPGMVHTMTAEGGVEFVNQQILDFLGRTREELNNWAMLLHPDDRSRVGELWTRSVATGEPFDVEHRVQCADGKYHWLHSRGLPLRDRSGDIVRWYHLLTDIDERKRAEELLRASEGNLKLIIDTIPALAWSARPDGSAEFLNQHYLDFIGLAAEQASGWDWTAAVHPDDLSGLTSTWQRVMASEARGEAEARLRRYDGVYRWFLFRANPLRDETGTIVKWYGVNTDIEDRKRAEEALRKSEHHFRLLVETIPALVWRGTPEGELDYLNQRAIEYLGRSAQSLSGGGWLELVHPDHRDTTIQRWLHSVATGSSYEDVYRLRRANGEYRWIQSVGQPFHDTEGRIAHWYGLVLDIEDRKESEEALNKARSELARVARITTMGTLTASIAHEVNQPLSGIITNAGTCLRMLDTAPPDIEGARQTARRTIRDGNRASDVITRLRALFSHKEFTLEPLDLNEATREVVALSLSDLQRNGVALQLELADDLPTITGDRIQLQQVILNLLRNASDAMVDVHDRTRHLLIKSEREDTARVRMTVRDVGVGVAPDSIDRLFDPFYTTKSDGMGIGLSVSRSIIERHQGRLWAQANDGSPGATFSFSIPREDGGRGAHPAPTTS